MSRVAPADRERHARMILDDSEDSFPNRLADAGRVYASHPTALHRRDMNTLYEVVRAGGTSTVIVRSSAVDSVSSRAPDCDH
jgi:hypothetical protein